MVNIKSEILLRDVLFAASKMQQLYVDLAFPNHLQLACLCPSPFQVLDPPLELWHSYTHRKLGKEVLSMHAV